MSVLFRIYPIRTTRNSWKIPLICYHKCKDSCNLLNNINENSSNDICLNKDKLEYTYVKLSSFCINNPTDLYLNPLYNPSVKVIPDNTFNVYLYYPLSHIVKVTITAPSSNGFTLVELISSIKVIYKFIYEEEERTSPIQTYNLNKICSICNVKKITDYVKDIGIPDSECCICYNKYDIENNGGKLECNHIFHNKCIIEWLNTSKTCPLCRSKLIKCENCDGLGIIYYDFTGTVIPLEIRGNLLNRNRTYGVFGIHTYDFEDLIIKSLSYNRISKILYIEITS